jgi:hypothetical protein
MTTRADHDLLAEWNRRRDYNDDDDYLDQLSNPPPHICKAIKQSFDNPEPSNSAKLLTLLLNMPSHQTERRNNPGTPAIGAISIHLLVMTCILLCWHGGRYICHGSSSLSSLPAAAASSSGGVAMSFWEGLSLLVDLSGSGPDTDKDTGELSRRNSIMNPVFALAAMDQESAIDDDEVFLDVVIKSAILHHLKRNANSRDLSFTPIQLTNMLQALIDNCGVS